MELNIEVFNKLNFLIDESKKNKNYELEARFSNKKKILITDEIFNRIFQKLTFSKDNNGYGFCGRLAYIPSSECRMITMNSGSSEKLNNIDIMVYWKDQYSNLHPMYLLPGCKCDIKILFRKK